MPKNAEPDEDTLRAAMAATEQEIFDDALGNEPLDNDGDRSLEEMGDELGDDIDEDADTEGEADEVEGQETEAAGEGDGDEPETEPEERTDNGRRPDGRTVALREERQRRQALELEIAELRGRQSVLERQPPQQRTEAEKPAKPDMFSDPEGWQKGVMDEARELARQEIAAARQQDHGERLNRSLAAVEAGPRGYEFGPAYRALSGLDRTNPSHRTIVQGVVNAPDPGKALMEWWDENGGEEFRDGIRQQLLGDQGGSPRRTNGGNGNGRAQHVIQPARPAGGSTRSLNGAVGGASQRQFDPRGLDGSESAIFDYAFQDKG